MALHRRRAIPATEIKTVRKAVATSADLAASGKELPLQGQVASAVHGTVPTGPKKKKTADLETTPQTPSMGEEATAPVSAAKSKGKTVPKVARKKVDPESIEGKALKAFVAMSLQDDEDEEDVEKQYNPEQPRGADGKWAPGGSASDTTGHANPYIKPSGNSAPAATASKEEHAAFHAKEMIHNIKQQLSAYNAGDTKSGDEIGKLVDSHTVQYQHYSGIKTVKTVTDDGVEVEKSIDEWALEIKAAKDNAPVEVKKSIFCEFISKAEAPEKQLVTGIVLSPEVVDAQGDIYDAEVIEKAAHTFLAKYNAGTKLGHLHKEFNRPLELVESYCAPSDMVVDGKSVTKGTWLMTVKVKDPTLWNDVKEGKLAGFSIGGVAKVMKLND